VRSHDIIATQFLVMRGPHTVEFLPPCSGLTTPDTRRKLWM